MKNLTPQEQLIVMAEQMKRAAPLAYEAFLGAFRNYTNAQVYNCVHASSDVLHVAQGRAQNCAQILDCLQWPSDKVNAMVEKANARPSGTH